MTNPDEIPGAICFIVIFLSGSGANAWYVTRARKTGRIFCYGKVPIGGSAYIDKKDDPASFSFAVAKGYFVSAVLVFAVVFGFLAIFFPNVIPDALKG